MTEPDKLAAMSILVRIISCALVTQSPLMMPLIHTMVDLSARYGNSSKAPFGYVWYGCALCWSLKDIELGYRFGRLAIDVMEKFGSREVETTVLHQFNSFIRHWCEHERVSLNEFPHVVQVSKETGDIEYGTYVAVNYVTNLLLCGESLAEAQEKQRPYLDWVADTKFSFSLTYGSIFAQTTQCLMGQGTGAGDALQGDFLDENKIIPEMRATKNNLNLFSIYTAKAMLSYFNGHFRESAAFAREAGLYELAIGSLLPVTQAPYYGALAILKTASVSAGIEPENTKTLELYEGKLQLWAEHGGMNFQHKYDLVQAEKARVMNDPWRAVKFYELAIKGARENNYLHEEALACELAASFYREEGLDELAGSAINNAYHLYEIWGALPKLEQLRQGYSKWLADKSMATEQSWNKALDFDSIVKAMRVLSESIVLSDLLAHMMDIVMENAGAQRGAIILKKKGEWFVEALSEIETDQASILISTPLEKSNFLPQGVIHYVINSGKNLYLAHACEEERFINDNFIQQQQTKSILCLPLKFHGELSGILYLENNLLENAFTQDRLEVLDIFVSQISISLENATLYSEIMSREEEIRLLLDSTAEGIYGLDQDGLCTFANPACLRMLGYDAIDDLLGQNMHNLIHHTRQDGSSYPMEECHIYEAFQRGIGTHVDDEVLWCKDGTSFSSEYWSFPITMKGKTSGSVVTFLDITERKQKEDEIIHLQTFQRNLLDSMPSVMIAVGEDGKVTLCNAEAERVTNISAEEAKGKKLDEIIPMLSGKMDKVLATIRDRKALKGERLSDQKNGEVIHSELMIYPLVENASVGAVVRLDDVTERVRMEELLVQTEKMMSVGGLAAGMAHEINNPLGGMLQAVQNIQRRFSPDLEKNRQAARECDINLDAVQNYMQKRQILNFLEGIHDSGERAAKIIVNMLQFSRRTDAGRAAVDITQLLDRTIELARIDYDLKKKYDFRQYDVVREYDPSLPLVLCQASDIEQVVLNLLRNAAQAIQSQKEYREKPRIILRARHEDGMARIEIGDNGPGMTEDVRKRVFEPFFTTKPAGMGTGLGLSVSYFLVCDAHGGHMSVESVPGQGATFIICLPIGKKGSSL
jgi:PAS domain S-box-containing protein